MNPQTQIEHFWGFFYRTRNNITGPYQADRTRDWGHSVQRGYDRVATHGYLLGGNSFFDNSSTKSLQHIQTEAEVKSVIAVLSPVTSVNYDVECGGLTQDLLNRFILPKIGVQCDFR